MMHASPESSESPFTVHRARRGGLPRSQTDAREFDRPFHGVRARPADAALQSTREERIRWLARQYAVVMGAHEFFTHVTGAVLWGIPLPPWVLTDILDVGVLTPHRHPRGRGVRGHEVSPALVIVQDHRTLGVRLGSPASVWAMLGSILKHPYDLVAAGDAVVRVPQHPDDPPALSTVERLAAATAAGRRVGVGALREALPLVRVGSSSRPETWTRLTLVDSGLPEPVLGWEVFDARGDFIGRVDLAYPQLRIAVEYEGGHHLMDPGQWNRDILRYERLVAEGWQVIRVTKQDVFERPGALVERVARAIARASR
jgi:hypothetical protein